MGPRVAHFLGRRRGGYQFETSTCPFVCHREQTECHAEAGQTVRVHLQRLFLRRFYTTFLPPSPSLFLPFSPNGRICSTVSRNLKGPPKRRPRQGTRSYHLSWRLRSACFVSEKLRETRVGQEAVFTQPLRAIFVRAVELNNLIMTRGGQHSGYPGQELRKLS